MRALALFMTLALSLASRAATAQETTPGFVVVVHPRNPVSSVDRKFLGDAFLKKVSRWGDDKAIRPVDATVRSPVRRRFTQDVLKRSVASVKSYWQQVIFSGRDVPPPELANDDEAVRYVTTHPQSIGYVSGAARLGDAHVVTIR